MADFNLPNEIWCQIFSYLPLEPKKNVTATCKLWYRLIREDPKFSGHILISWHNMKTALDTLQWNWSNWPALKTLELNKLERIEDLRASIQNVIEKLSLKDHCPASLEEVLFDNDLTPIQTNGQSTLKYRPHTNQIFGLGQELFSIQRWNEYESNIKALTRLESLREPDVWYWPETPAAVVQLGKQILAELAPNPSNDPILLIASPLFLTFRRLCDEYVMFEPIPHPNNTDGILEYWNI
jgi:hypothetical protein